jgi:hypothetical protein
MWGVAAWISVSGFIDRAAVDLREKKGEGR